MGKQKIVKMKFGADQYYVTAANKEKDLQTPMYFKDKVYGIEESMVQRWLKRGGVIVEDEQEQAPVKGPAKQEDKKTETRDEGKEQVDGEKEKADDGGKPMRNADKRGQK